MSEALKTNTELTSLNLGCMFQCLISIFEISNDSHQNTVNVISVPGARALSQALKVNASLETLNLWSTNTKQEWNK